MARRRRIGSRRVANTDIISVNPESFNDQLDLDIGAMEKEQDRQVGAMSSKRESLNDSVNAAGNTAFRRGKRLDNG